MFIRSAAVISAFVYLFSGPAFAGSGNDQISGDGLRPAAMTNSSTSPSANDTHRHHLASAPQAIGKTRAAVKQELDAYWKNPVTGDGYCIKGDADARYVGPAGKC